MSDTALLRQHAKAIFHAGVAAANPYDCVKQHLQHIAIAAENIQLIAFGKAACRMAQAAQDILHIPQGIAVTNYENVTAVNNRVVHLIVMTASPLRTGSHQMNMSNIEVIGAGHPLPDLAGFHAAQKIAKRVSAAKQNELVLVLISGGGSALLPYPVESISLQDKIATTNALLACGASINEINCVRKHLSQLKGGRLAQLAAPATLHALILSDVIGDDLSAIASGTTVADNSTYSDALAILQNRQIWQSVPATVRQYLTDGATGKQPETPKANDSVFATVQNTLIGSNALSVQASLSTAQSHGYAAQIYSNALCGNARDEADKLARYAKQLGDISQPIALIAGGETTVQLKGNGLGGRNQEFALAFALAAEQHGLSPNWVLLSGGTDGRDGPTDAAGGLVDAQSLQRMSNAGLQPVALLNNNDSYHALAAANDLLITGATGTNVADLQILLL